MTEQNAVASQEQVTVSQEPKQEASQQVPTTETPEFQRLVQSEADKRAKVYKQQLQDLQAEHRVEMRKLQEQLETLKGASEDGRQERQIDALMAKYAETGEMAEDVIPTARDWAKETLKLRKQARETLKQAQEKEQAIAAKEKEIADLLATRAVQKLATELGVSLTGDDAEAIAKKTQGNVDWATDLIQAKAVKPVESEKVKPKRPDSSIPSAPGGKLTDTQLREQYASGKISNEAYEKECRERGIPPS